GPHPTVDRKTASMAHTPRLTASMTARKAHTPRSTARVNPTIHGTMLRIARGVGWWSVYSRVDPRGQPGAGGAGGAGGGRAGRAGGGRAGRAGGGRAGGGGAGLLGIVSDAQPIPEWVFKFYCQPGIDLI